MCMSGNISTILLPSILQGFASPHLILFLDYLISVVSPVFPRSSVLAGPIWCCLSGYGIFWSCSSVWSVSERDFFSKVFSSVLLITSSRKLTTVFFWMASLSKTTLIVFRVRSEPITLRKLLRCVSNRGYISVGCCAVYRTLLAAEVSFRSYPIEVLILKVRVWAPWENQVFQQR